MIDNVIIGFLFTYLFMGIFVAKSKYNKKIELKDYYDWIYIFFEFYSYVFFWGFFLTKVVLDKENSITFTKLYKDIDEKVREERKQSFNEFQKEKDKIFNKE